MKQISISAVDDGDLEGGHVALRARGLSKLSRFRLKPVGPTPAKEPHWPAGFKVPISVMAHDDAIDLVIGPDVAEHAALLPGTPVVFEAPDEDVCGEFLWPTVAPRRRAKRKRLTHRIGMAEPPRPIEPAVEVQPEPVIPPEPVVAPITTPAPRPSALRIDPAPVQMPRAAPVPADLPPKSALSHVQPRDPVAGSPPVEAPHAVIVPALPKPTATDVPALIEKVQLDATPAPAPVSTPEVSSRDPLYDLFEAPLITHDRPQRAAVLTPAAPVSLPSPALVTAPIVTPRPPTTQPPADLAEKAALPRSPRPARNLPRTALAAGFLGAIAAGGVYLLWPETPGWADATADVPMPSATSSGPAFRDARRLPPKELPPSRPTGPVAVPVASSVPAAPTAPQPPLATPPPTSPPAPPAKPVEVASVTVPVLEPSKAVKPTCSASDVRTKPLPGGMMNLHVTDACHRNEDAVLAYGTYTTLVRFDEAGVFEQTIDCIFGTTLPVELRFPDGVKVAAMPTCGDMERIAKVAVIWRAPINLDLHAFERPTPAGERGQVSAGAPRTVDAARRLSDLQQAPRGFLSSRADQRTPGPRIEVYTAFLGRYAQTIPLALDFETRASGAAGDACGQGLNAEPTYELIRLSPTGQVTQETGRFQPLGCDARQTAPQRFNQGGLAPLRAGSLPLR